MKIARKNIMGNFFFIMNHPILNGIINMSHYKAISLKIQLKTIETIPVKDIQNNKASK